MFRDLLAIRLSNQVAALQWIHQWGFPTAYIQLAIDDWLTAICSIQWLWDFSRAVLNTDYAKLKQWQYMLQPPDLALLNLPGADPASVYVTFSPNPAKPIADWREFIVMSDGPSYPRGKLVGVSIGSPQFFKLVLQNSGKAWKNDECGECFFAAKAFLVRAFDMLLSGVHPAFDLEYARSEDLHHWILVPTEKVTCPWHALNLALYKRLQTYQPQRSCTECDKMWSPKYRSQLTCSGRCKKRRQRRLKQEAGQPSVVLQAQRRVL
ncbi:MAG: hypothetical protein HY711_05735 [Candidatus Melainabacteria bacterium]|nr:hypothetical protein [Candidatus Melainabacteria bacterium]